MFPRLGTLRGLATTAELTETVTLEEPDHSRDWRLLVILLFCAWFGFGIYNGVFQNYLRDGIGVNPNQVGVLESIREVPGLICALTVGALLAFAEARVAALGLAIMAIGIAATGMIDQYLPVLVMTVLWSIGFHVFAGVQPAIALTLAKGHESGRRLGELNAVGSVANLAALGLAALLAWLFVKLDYDVYFYLAGGFIFIASLICFRLSPAASARSGVKMVWRREYGMYYLLTFLEGCRRQIVSTFAAFVLILVYDVSLRDMILLHLIAGAVVAVTAPMIGRMIDVKSERGPLLVYSVATIVMFIGYATIPVLPVLMALFVIDKVMFSFSIGITTYMRRIVRKEDMTPTVAMGVTMNHVAAVALPVLGGYLWYQSNDYRIPFYIGIAVAVAAWVATYLLPRRSDA